jgi:hypothetical protein
MNDHQKKNDNAIVIDDTMVLLLRKKRRSFLHQTCLLSVMAAFTIGLAMGIFFLPLIGLTSAKSPNDSISQAAAIKYAATAKVHKYDFVNSKKNKNQIHELKGMNSFTPTTINNNFLNPTIYSSVSFISDEKYSTENILNGWNNGKLARRVNNDYGIEVDDDVAIEIPDKDDGNRVDEGSNNSENSRNMNNDFDDLERDRTVDAGEQ